ncbi:LysR substrate-binding domain-containing protein [Kitasatospora aureofaciens]|uniref:LysR substrate-binding domain-containing protein n=1 Tax=Kitasatospora aureofaciens TaxID=1894 RepID=UPI0037CAACEA
MSESEAAAVTVVDGWLHTGGIVRVDGAGRVHIVVPADHPLAALDEAPLAVLAEHPLLVHTADESAEWRDWVDRAVEAFGLTVATRLRGHGRTSALAAVQALCQPSSASPPPTSPTASPPAP